MKLKEEFTDSKTLLILFSGYGNSDKEEKSFEWTRMTDGMGINRVFVRDTKCRWYQTCIDELKDYLMPIAEGKRVVTIGASMGGYAAILFAHILGGSSLTFGPQTTLLKSHLEDYDLRWTGRIYPINETTKHPDYLDLGFIKGHQHHIWYGKGNKEDRFHAERMDVSLHPMDISAHAVAQTLKHEGRLKSILTQTINEEA